MFCLFDWCLNMKFISDIELLLYHTKSLFFHKLRTLAFLFLLHLFFRVSFPVLLQLLVNYPKGLIHVSTCKTGSYAAASLKGDESVIVPSFKISRHPISPLSNIHAPDFTLPSEVFHLNKLYFAVGYGLGVGKREVIALYFDSLVGNRDIFVIVENFLLLE